MEIVLNSEISCLELVDVDESCDVYALPEDKQLIVYTDRIYLSGIPLEKPIPFKGIVINQISQYWIEKFSHMVGHTIVERKVDRYPLMLRAYAKQLMARSVIVQKLRELPLEFHVIGSITPALMQEYQETGRLGSRLLPKGLKECDRLENPTLKITPLGDFATQEVDDMGRWCQRMYGQKLFSTIEDICYSIFGVARNYAGARGITIADAKFQFALFEGNPYIIGQVMTPDSATYWPADGYPRGQIRPSFEKQALQKWLDQQGWEGSEPMPDPPKEVLVDVTNKYRTIFDIMTGKVAKSNGDGAE